MFSSCWFFADSDRADKAEMPDIEEIVELLQRRAEELSSVVSSSVGTALDSSKDRLGYLLHDEDLVGVSVACTFRRLFELKSVFVAAASSHSCVYCSLYECAGRRCHRRWDLAGSASSIPKRHHKRSERTFEDCNYCSTTSTAYVARKNRESHPIKASAVLGPCCIVALHPKSSTHSPLLISCIPPILVLSCAVLAKRIHRYIPQTCPTANAASEAVAGRQA